MSRSATPLPQPSFADTFLPPVHSPSSNSTNTPAFFGMLPSISQTPVTPHPATNLHSPIKRSLRFSTSDASTAKRTKIFTALPPASETVPTPNLTPDVSPSRGRDDGDGSGDRIPHEKCVRCGQHGLAGARRLPNDVLQCVRCDCEMNAPYTDLTEDEVASEEGTVASGAEEEKELEAVQGLREGVRRSGRVKKAIAKVVELPPTGGRRRLQRGKPVATAFTVRDGDETEAGSMVETVSNCGSSSAEGSFVGMVGVLAAAAAALVAVGDDTNAAVENMVMDESAKMEGGIHVADVEDGDDEAAFILAGLGVLRS
ncbi:hypothetical protein BC830DRAFT_206792 [Chytriomyces sp. MP71]|nr:hypothetical protein BC830DRAFT_206792 [Chytriomyces sp. MP71]